MHSNVIGVTLSVKVKPGASRNSIEKAPDGTLLVRLQARPVEGAANQALVKLLSNALGIRQRDITILSGHRARTKRIWIDTISAKIVKERLGVADINTRN